VALNYSVQVYRPAFNIFARPVTFVGNAVPSSGRGIYNTDTLDVMTEDGSVLSDQRTVLDILEEEYTVLPSQDDTVIIPADLDLPALGEFKVIDVKTNGGGETTLTLRKVVVSKP
jgi:hypothetical protein